MKFLENISYTNIDAGIEYLKNHSFNNHLPNNEHTIYHVYWYGKINRHQLCCMYSYLYSQDLSSTELWVWLDINTYQLSKSSIPKHRNIKIKIYNPYEEVKNTPFEGYKYLDQTKSLKFRSDIARILVLYNYGGLYFDLDMLLLKDLKPILDLEFCYSWSDLKKGNNGILRLKKKSKLCCQIIEKYKNSISPFNLHNQTFFLGYNHKYIFTDDLDLTCLPCVLFDPVWVLEHRKQISKYSKLHTFDDFFKNTDENIDEFFENEIFTYHWHSRNNANIEHNSYFERFENKFKNKIK